MLTNEKPLTNLEHEVIQHVTKGLTDAKIGKKLGISHYTVRFHLNSVFRKLDVYSRTEAAVVYIQSQFASNTSQGGA